MTRRSLLLLLFVTILMASCGASGAGEATPDVKGTIQANAETMVAALFETQTALAPPATNTALPTATSLATSTALSLSTATVFVQQPVLAAASPTATGPTFTPLPSSLSSGCKNLRLINSWTAPESPLMPNQQFTQNWQVENSGTCDWLFVFDVIHVSGDKTGEATSQRFGNKIPPGKWTTIQIGMRAPNKSGTYKASWKMSDGGNVFGDALPVSITVGGPTSTPKPDTAATDAAAAQNAVNTAVAATLTQAAINQAATLTKEALCASNPTPAVDPPCPTPIVP